MSWSNFVLSGGMKTSPSFLCAIVGKFCTVLDPIVEGPRNAERSAPDDDNGTRGAFLTFFDNTHVLQVSIYVGPHRLKTSPWMHPRSRIAVRCLSHVIHERPTCWPSADSVMGITWSSADEPRTVGRQGSICLVSVVCLPSSPCKKWVFQ